jgi:hypothetical protein
MGGSSLLPPLIRWTRLAGAGPTVPRSEPSGDGWKLLAARLPRFDLGGNVAEQNCNATTADRISMEAGRRLRNLSDGFGLLGSSGLMSGSRVGGWNIGNGLTGPMWAWLGESPACISGVERTGLHQKVSARFSICSVIASRAWDKIIFLRVLLGLTKLEFSAILRSKQATPAKYVTFVHFVAVSGQLDPQF